MIRATQRALGSGHLDPINQPLSSYHECQEVERVARPDTIGSRKLVAKKRCAELDGDARGARNEASDAQKAAVPPNLGHPNTKPDLIAVT